MTLLFTVENDTDLIELKNEIENVCLWANSNRLIINAGKSKVLYFNKNSTTLCLLPHDIFGITVCKTLKLLGVTFNERLDFAEHFNLVLKCASQRLHFLRVLKPIYSKEQLWKVFNSLIRSILEYACPLFMKLPKYLCLEIEKIQTRAHRIICDQSIICNCQVGSLESRRVELGRRLFCKACADEHPLSSFIPKRRNKKTLFYQPSKPTEDVPVFLSNVFYITMVFILTKHLSFVKNFDIILYM